jgi:hypothetical protein
MLKTFLCLLFVAVVALCQSQPPLADLPTQTFGQANGRLWQARSTQERLVYVIGALDAVMTVSSKELANYLPKSLDYSELVTAIDRFYTEPENIPIPVIHAMRIVTAKTNGASPAVIEDTKAAIRKAIADQKK